MYTTRTNKANLRSFSRMLLVFDFESRESEHVLDSLCWSSEWLAQKCLIGIKEKKKKKLTLDPQPFCCLFVQSICLFFSCFVRTNESFFVRLLGNGWGGGGGWVVIRGRKEWSKQFKLSPSSIEPIVRRLLFEWQKHPC
jgi:hypothetical protein